jgi:hypothetical protein
MTRFWIGALAGLPILAVTAGSLFAQAARNDGQAQGRYSGEFAIYGGAPGDIVPPTEENARLGLTIEGPLAARMYRELGPKAQQKECVPDNMEIRDQGDISCGREKGGGRTTCYIAFDLRAGKSVYPTAC